MKEHYPKIKILVTRNLKFRAEIKLTKEHRKFQVSIGGKTWKENIPLDLQKEIITKCKIVSKYLTEKTNDYEKSYKNTSDIDSV